MEYFSDIKTTVEKSIFNGFDSIEEIGLNIFEYKNVYTHYLTVKNEKFSSIIIDYNNGIMTVNNNKIQLACQIIIKSLL